MTFHNMFAMSVLSAFFLLGTPVLAFEARTFEADDGTTWPYRLLKPGDYDANMEYPMVLFLHGAGESGNDNGLQLKHIVRKFAEPQMMEKFPCFVIAPQNPHGMKWADVAWGAPRHSLADKPTLSLAAALELCDAIIDEFNIDKGRIYCVGLSMGGYGTWDALMRRPDFFAAAVPICGGADDTKADLIKHIPVWVFHGARDPTVPVIRSRNIVAALKEAGADPEPTYTEFPNVNHKSWGPAFATPGLFDWLFAQKRVIKKPPSDVAMSRDRELRTWTSRKGSTVTARLVKTSGYGSTVYLLTEDGKAMRIMGRQLSDEDNAYIESQKE